MTKESQQPFAQRLRDERLHYRWSQQELADHLGTTPVTISRWENGVSKPSPYFRLKLGQIFKKSFDEIVGEPDAKSSYELQAGVAEQNPLLLTADDEDISTVAKQSSLLLNTAGEDISTAMPPMPEDEMEQTLPSIGFLSSEENESGGQDAQQPSTAQDTSSQLPTTSLPLWTLPHRRNPFFTGREDILSRLHHLLQKGKTTVTQVQAMSGLGGIGKTQVAIEYAYRFRDEYSAIFWLRAETRDVLIADLVGLAELLLLPEKDEPNQNTIIKAVKLWLESSSKWLLILDNVEDFTMVAHILPRQSKGQHILLTTRAQTTGTLADRITLDQMKPDEGALFLLRRAKLLESDALLEEAPESLRIQAKDLSQLLDGLPLALDQAGAYIEETGCSLSNYQHHYHLQQTALLQRRGTLPIDHPDSVYTTVRLCVEQVQLQSAIALELLHLFAFLYVENIPEVGLLLGASELGPVLATALADPLALDTALAVLRRFSLIQRHADIRTLTLHRLVQVVVLSIMDHPTQQLWAERAVRCVNQMLPDLEQLEVWPSWLRRQLPKQMGIALLMCVTLIEQWKLTGAEIARVLYAAGIYFLEQQQVMRAEHFLQHASVLAQQAHIALPDRVTSLTTYHTLLHKERADS